MVTAELAALLPVVVLLLAVGLGAVRYGIDQVRCVDAARAAARAAARGDSSSEVVEVGLRGAPAGATVSVTRGGGLVRVSVTAPAPAPGILLTLPELNAEAVADEEVSGEETAREEVADEEAARDGSG